MKEIKELFWQYLEPEYTKGVKFCRKLMNDRDQGDDLYQEALLKAYSGFTDLRDYASFRSWLYRIIINTFKETIRRPWWKRRVRWNKDVEDKMIGKNPLDQLRAQRLLNRVFQVLSPEKQTLVILYELEGWSVAELAVIYNKSESSIKTALFRARMKMKKALEKYGNLSGAERKKYKSSREGKECIAVKLGSD